MKKEKKKHWTVVNETGSDELDDNLKQMTYATRHPGNGGSGRRVAPLVSLSFSLSRAP